MQRLTTTFTPRAPALLRPCAGGTSKKTKRIKHSVEFAHYHSITPHLSRAVDAHLAEAHADRIGPVRGPRRKHSHPPLQERWRHLRREGVAAAVLAHAGVSPGVLLVRVEMERPENPPTAHHGCCRIYWGGGGEAVTPFICRFEVCTALVPY